MGERETLKEVLVGEALNMGRLWGDCMKNHIKGLSIEGLSPLGHPLWVVVCTQLAGELLLF